MAFGEEDRRSKVPFSSHLITIIWFITIDIDLDHLTEVVSVCQFSSFHILLTAGVTGLGGGR